MDKFYSVVKYRGEGCVLDFIFLTGWESILKEICTYWALKALSVRVNYVTPYEHKTMASINLEDDFQRMCNIHCIFKINVVDMMLETVNNNSTKGTFGSSTPL